MEKDTRVYLDMREGLSQSKLADLQNLASDTNLMQGPSSHEDRDPMLAMMAYHDKILLIFIRSMTQTMGGNVINLIGEISHKTFSFVYKNLLF